MSVNASIAVALAAMLASDQVETKLNAIQAQLSSKPDPPPPYVAFDRRTIIAGFRWHDDDVPQGLIVAYHVSKSGALKQVATFKYDDIPFDLNLVDATGDGRPEVLVSGRPGRSGAASMEILGWDGRRFADLGQTSTSGTTFIDIDGDGVPEVLTRGRSGTNDCGIDLITPYVERYGDSGLVEVQTPDLEDFVQVTKTGDGPESFETDIALRDEASKSCTLHIINGTSDGRHRARGMRMAMWPMDDELSTRTIPVELTVSDATLDETVTLESRCTGLQILVAGPRNTTVTILVYAPRTERQAAETLKSSERIASGPCF